MQSWNLREIETRRQRSPVVSTPTSGRRLIALEPARSSATTRSRSTRCSWSTERASRGRRRGIDASGTLSVRAGRAARRLDRGGAGSCSSSRRGRARALPRRRQRERTSASVFGERVAPGRCAAGSAVHRAIHEVHERDEERRVDDGHAQPRQDRLVAVDARTRRRSAARRSGRACRPAPRGRLRPLGRPSASALLRGACRCASPFAASARLELRRVDLDLLALVVDVDVLVLVPALLLAPAPLLPRRHRRKRSAAQRVQATAPRWITVAIRSPPRW